MSMESHMCIAVRILESVWWNDREMMGKWFLETSAYAFHLCELALPRARGGLQQAGPCGTGTCSAVLGWLLDLLVLNEDGHWLTFVQGHLCKTYPKGLCEAKLCMAPKRNSKNKLDKQEELSVCSETCRLMSLSECQASGGYVQGTWVKPRQALSPAALCAMLFLQIFQEEVIFSALLSWVAIGFGGALQRPDWTFSASP